MGLTGDSRSPGSSPSDPTTPDRHVPSGVVWDLGRVLVDWRAVEAIAAGVGREEAERFLAAEDFDFHTWNHGPDSGGTWAEAEAEVQRTHPHWARHALSYRPNFAASLVGEVPGSGDLVRELRAAGVPQWGLTNWSAELWHHATDAFDLLDLLDGVVVSGLEKVAKPDPAAFELVGARSGLPLEELVFLDDRDDNVAAARALGMTGIVFTDAADARTRLRALGLPV